MILSTSAISALLFLGGFSAAQADMDKRVRDACEHKNPLIRVQAARRVAKGGTASVDALMRFVEAKGSNALSSELVSMLGDLREEKLRVALRKWVDDADFAWRPQALLSLAKRPEKSEAGLFNKYVKDGSWLMRRSALAGLAGLGGKSSIRELQNALSDKDKRVAVRAATLLVGPLPAKAKGKKAVAASELRKPPYAKQALPVLVRALDAEDPFFGDDFGYLARKEAFQTLRQWSGQDFGYRVSAPRAARKGPIARFRRLVETALGNAMEMPRPRPVRAWSLGFERRSCRDGDVVLRLDAQGRLWRGVFDLEQIDLDPEARKELRRLARAVGPQRRKSYGKIRCDLTRFAGLGAAGNINLRAAPGAAPEFLSALEKRMLAFDN